MPFSFRFCLCIYHPSCPTTRAWLPQINVELKIAHLHHWKITVSPLQGKVIARLQPGKNRCVNVSISNM